MKLLLWVAAVAVLLSVGATAHGDPVELLHNVPAQVAVSSVVDSATITKEDLLDGNRETAWNSRTGDLVGAWIAFRVPAEVTVDSIKLIVGHTGHGKEGDYFPMNHRIKRVRVLRGTDKVGEFTLDPNSRELQALPIHVPGGEYKVVVLETVPGTKRSWRELCVAEFEVWGTLPPGEQPRHHSERDFWSFDVGKLPKPWFELTRDPRPTADLTARCALNNCTLSDPNTIADPHLMGKPHVLHPTGSRFKTLMVDGNGGYERLFLQTDAGWWYGGAPTVGSMRFGGPIVLEDLSVTNDVARIVVDHHKDAEGQRHRVAMYCGLSAAGVPACTPPILLEMFDATGASTRHKVSVAGDVLTIDRDGSAPAWEWTIGDYRLAW